MKARFVLLVIVAVRAILGDVSAAESTAPSPAAATKGEKDAASATGGGEATPAPADPLLGFREPETYLDFAVAGGPLMIPIAFCSVLWMAFLVERLLATRRGKVLPQALATSLKTLGGAGDFDAVRASSVLDAHPSTAATILRTAIRHLDGPRQDLELAVNSVAQREARILRRYVRIFAVIASVAPLLGLLGTVQGMIQAFRVVSSVGLGAGRNLAPGIYVALITTAGGLLVAIPSLITYYWFIARVDRQLHEIDTLAIDLVEAHGAPRPEGAKP
jgi:biopolymer transport protein ExbB